VTTTPLHPDNDPDVPDDPTEPDHVDPETLDPTNDKPVEAENPT
jgi:hypothetical protein